jgi:hypothetical protein
MENEVINGDFYNRIKDIMTQARAKAYSAVNFAMVEAYWEIGKSIVERQGGNATAEYGSNLIEQLSKQMTADFGKGFTSTNLKYMRQFYLAFPNRHALRDQLSWTHYRMTYSIYPRKKNCKRKLPPSERLLRIAENNRENTNESSNLCSLFE